jgi:hypothetical protein
MAEEASGAPSDWKTFLWGHAQSNVLHHGQKMVINNSSFLKKQVRTDNFAFHQSAPHIDLS